MSKRIFRVNIGIIIDEVLVAGVIWRIYIDYVNFTCMGICEGGKGFEVVALDKYMIGGIGTGIGECAVFDLDEYRKFVAQTVFYIFWLILPYQSVSFGFSEKPEKCRAFIVGQSLQCLDAVYKFMLVSRFHPMCHLCDEIFTKVVKISQTGADLSHFCQSTPMPARKTMRMQGGAT